MPWAIPAAIGGSALIGASASGSAAKKQAEATREATQAQLQMFNQSVSNLEPWMNQGQLSLQALSQGLGLRQPQGNARLTEADVQKIYQRYMGRPVGADEMAWLMANNQTPAQLEMSVSQSPEHQFHVSGERRVAPVNSPMYGNGQQASGIESGSLIKPFGLDDFKESPAYQFNLQQGQKAIDNAASKNKTLYAPGTLQDVGRFSQGLASNEFNTAYGQYNQNMKNIWDRLYAMSGSGQNAAAQQGAFGTTVGGQIGENMIGAGNAAAAGRIGQANAIAGGVGQGLNAYWMNQMLNQSQIPLSGIRSQPALTGAGDIFSNMG